MRFLCDKIVLIRFCLLSTKITFYIFLHRFHSILEQFGTNISSDLGKFHIRTSFRSREILNVYYFFLKIFIFECEKNYTVTNCSEVLGTAHICRWLIADRCVVKICVVSLSIADHGNYTIMCHLVCGESAIKKCVVRCTKNQPSKSV